MSSSAVDTPRANHVAITDDELIVRLVDGRTIIVPLAWFPALLHASPEQRDTFRLIGDGEFINWPELDEDLSVAGLLRGPGRDAGMRPNASRRTEPDPPRAVRVRMHGSEHEPYSE